MNKIVNSVCITRIRVKLHTYIKLIPYFTSKQRSYIPYILWALNQCLSWPITKPRYCLTNNKSLDWLVLLTSTSSAPQPPLLLLPHTFCLLSLQKIIGDQSGVCHFVTLIMWSVVSRFMRSWILYHWLIA